MKALKILVFVFFIASSWGVIVFSCSEKEEQQEEIELSSEVVPYDLSSGGSTLLSDMMGQWVGSNTVSGVTYEWFAFDYRPISSSHIFGIYEGGTMGNLLTSFFVTNFNGTKTIMARNGGVLSSIYRTSYLVLDRFEDNGESRTYRLVDAYGGSATMWIDITVTGDSLNFDAYTSNLGAESTPSAHMNFIATRNDRSLADTAATELSFPNTDIAFSFVNGFTESHLYVNQGADRAYSATFLTEGSGDLDTLAEQAYDPFPRADHPYLANVTVNVTRPSGHDDKKVFLYFSKDALVDSSGRVSSASAQNSILLFPELQAGSTDLELHYMHPGSYYVTAVVDANNDRVDGSGDYSKESVLIDVTAESSQTINIEDLTLAL